MADTAYVFSYKPDGEITEHKEVELSDEIIVGFQLLGQDMRSTGETTASRLCYTMARHFYAIYYDLEYGDTHDISSDEA